MAKGRSNQLSDMLLPSQGVYWDINAFDELLRNHGVTLVHYKAILCPLGVEDRFDIRSHADHQCSNGFLYKQAGTITAFFSGNSVNPAFEEIGIVDGSTTQITLPRTYDESDKELTVQEYDRFFLGDIQTTSIHSQRFEAHQSGLDRMEFVVEGVEYLVDSHGLEYLEGGDFIIADGYIKWLPQGRKPGYDPVLSKGTICSIRYSFRPFWYVKSLLHEVRVARNVDPLTGEVALIRMPHAVTLVREIAFHNQARYESDGGNPRSQMKPTSGGFGPR